MALNDDLEKGNKLLSERAGIQEDIIDDLRDYSNLLRDQLKTVQLHSQEKREIFSTTNQINKIAQQNYTILEKELGTEKLISKIGKDKELLQKKIYQLNQLSNKTLTNNKKLQAEVSSNIKESITSTQNLIKEMGIVEEMTKGISKNLGVKTFGALSDITKKLPGLNRFSEPFTKASEASRSMASRMARVNAERKTLSGKPIFSKKQMNISSLKSGFKSLSGSLTKSLGPIALIVGLVKTIMEVDKAVGDMAKGMNVSYESALAMKSELTQAAIASGDIFVTSKGMSESLLSINKTLGTNVKLNMKNLGFFTRMRESAGFTNEELMGMQSLANATGGDLETMTGEFMAQVKLSNIKNKVALNEKTLMKEIGSISAATTLSYGKDVKLLGNAVATTKALGMEMSKVEGIADSLLSFETSISNELEAELLIGRELNLEKARELALNNDIAGVASEIANQMGSSAEFSTLNRIQQEALAKAVGMNREDLARTLLLQEQIGNVSKEDYALREKQIKDLESQGLTQAQIKEKLAKTSISDLKNQASMQERLNASVEKLKEIFVIVAEAVMPILDVFTGVFELLGPIIKLLNPLIQLMILPLSIATDLINTLIFGAKWVANLFGAGFDTSGFEFGKATKNNFTNMGKSVGIVEDGIADSSKGPFTITDKFGATSITTDGDNLAVSPNITNSTTPIQNQSQLIAEVKQMNATLKQLLQKDTNIEIDGTILNKKVQQSLSTLG